MGLSEKAELLAKCESELSRIVHLAHHEGLSYMDLNGLIRDLLPKLEMMAEGEDYLAGTDTFKPSVADSGDN